MFSTGVRSKVTYSIFVLDIYILSFRYIWFCLYRLKNKLVIYIDLDQQSLLTLWGCQSLENKISRWPCLETSFSQVFSGIRSISDSKLWEKKPFDLKDTTTNGRKLILIPQKNSGVPGLKERFMSWHFFGRFHWNHVLCPLFCRSPTILVTFRSVQAWRWNWTQKHEQKTAGMRAENGRSLQVSLGTSKSTQC